MSRKLRRLQEKKNKTDMREIQTRWMKEAEDIAMKAAKEAEEITRHHITGEILTTLAIILRKAPYRWSAEKVLRLLDAIAGVSNAFNRGEICDADLVAEGEKYGIKVLWSAKREYITDISVFEEAAE